MKQSPAQERKWQEKKKKERKWQDRWDNSLAVPQKVTLRIPMAQNSTPRRTHTEEN